MSNARIVLAIALSAVCIVLAERHALARLRESNGELAAQLQRLEGSLSTLANAEALWNEPRPESSESATPSALAPIQLGAEREEPWPSNKSYFYMPKALLRAAKFQRFQATGESIGLHRNIIIALGMTPEDAAALDDELQNLTLTFKTLESQRLALSSIHASTNFPKGKKTSYWIPPLKAELEPQVKEFFRSARAMLQPTQGEMFVNWAREPIESRLRGFTESGRILTFTDEEWSRGRTLSRFEVANERGDQIYYFELWNPPGQIGGPWPEGAEHLIPKFPFRHLFGDDGQRRPLL